MSSTGTCADYQNHFDSKATARAEQNLTYSGNALEVESQNGAVSVRHATGSVFAITVCKAAGALNDDAAQQLRSQVSVQERNGKLATTGPDGGRWAVDLIITVPDSRSITVRGENGPVSFNGVNATIDASVQNGPLSFHDSRGEMRSLPGLSW